MPTLEEFMPADLRERLRNAPARELPSAAAYLEGWPSGRASAGNAERAGVEADARAWREAMLTSGEVIATGFAAGAGIGAARVTIPAERWRGLRYDPARNAAVDRATKAVVATGLDFEVAAAPEALASAVAQERKPGGRPRKATENDIADAVQQAGLDPAKMTLLQFFEALRNLGIDPKADALAKYCDRFETLQNHRERIEKARRQVFG